MTLHPDYTATLTTPSRTGPPIQEPAEWRFLNERKWQLRIIIPPQPDVSGLEDGAVEVIDHTVLSFSGDRMEVASFDSEPTVYERVDQVA